MARSPIPKPSQFPSRVKFNWGYHDAAAEFARGSAQREVTTHSSDAYAAGYLRGWDDAAAGRSTESSATAWEGYTNA